jgi:hypothetical protein
VNRSSQAISQSDHGIWLLEVIAVRRLAMACLPCMRVEHQEQRVSSSSRFDVIAANHSLCAIQTSQFINNDQDNDNEINHIICILMMCRSLIL